jgi:hypothetical protein
MIETTLSGAGIFLLGVFIALWGMKVKAKVDAARGWPKARGRLNSVDIPGKGVKMSDTHDYRSYFFRISYDYEVKGQKYTHDRPLYGNMISTKQDVDAFCEQFSEGDEIKVIYNPDDPQDAVLMFDLPTGRPSGGAGAGILLCVLGLIIGVVPYVMGG